MFLAVYNLAFIAPLIVIFILAAKGADSEQMSRWSKRNVFPSKIAMGFVFVILGALILPKFGGFLVEALAEF
jgi:cytochrome c biogenesis protein CcdA